MVLRPRPIFTTSTHNGSRQTIESLGDESYVPTRLAPPKQHQKGQDETQRHRFTSPPHTKNTIVPARQSLSSDTATRIPSSFSTIRPTDRIAIAPSTGPPLSTSSIVFSMTKSKGSYNITNNSTNNSRLFGSNGGSNGNTPSSTSLSRKHFFTSTPRRGIFRKENAHQEGSLEMRDDLPLNDVGEGQDTASIFRHNRTDDTSYAYRHVANNNKYNSNSSYMTDKYEKSKSHQNNSDRPNRRLIENKNWDDRESPINSKNPYSMQGTLGQTEKVPHMDRPSFFKDRPKSQEPLDSHGASETGWKFPSHQRRFSETASAGSTALPCSQPTISSSSNSTFHQLLIPSEKQSQTQALPPRTVFPSNPKLPKGATNINTVKSSEYFQVVGMNSEFQQQLITQQDEISDLKQQLKSVQQELHSTQQNWHSTQQELHSTQQELHSIKQRNQDEKVHFQLQQEDALGRCKQEYEDKLVLCQKQHDDELERCEQQYENKLASCQRQCDEELVRCRLEFEDQMASCQQRCREETVRSQQQCQEDISRSRQQSKEELGRLQQQYREEMDRSERQYQDELVHTQQELRDKFKDELDKMKLDWERETERKLRQEIRVAEVNERQKMELELQAWQSQAREEMEQKEHLLEEVQKQSREIRDELEQCQDEVKKLMIANEKMKVYCTSLEKDVDYYKNAKEQSDAKYQMEISSLIEEHDLEHESNLEETHEWRKQCQIIQQSLEEERMCNAVLSKEKSVMSEIIDEYLDKVDSVNRKNREVEKENKALKEELIEILEGTKQ